MCSFNAKRVGRSHGDHQKPSRCLRKPHRSLLPHSGQNCQERIPRAQPLRQCQSSPLLSCRTWRIEARTRAHFSPASGTCINPVRAKAHGPGGSRDGSTRFRAPRQPSVRAAAPDVIKAAGTPRHSVAGHRCDRSKGTAWMAQTFTVLVRCIAELRRFLRSAAHRSWGQGPAAGTQTSTRLTSLQANETGAG